MFSHQSCGSLPVGLPTFPSRVRTRSLHPKTAGGQGVFVLGQLSSRIAQEAGCEW